MSRCLRLLCAAMLGLAAAGLVESVAADALPPGWAAYHRERALFVPHPVGWQVQERGEGAFIAFLPSSGTAAQALAYVRPQRYGRDRNAADALGRLPREEAALFPQARIARGGALPQNTRGVWGELHFSVQGQPYRGVAVAMQSGATGTLFVMCATEAAWPVQAGTLAQILNGFRYLPPVAPAARQRDDLAVQWTQWRDPREGAFTVPVPAGWSVQGGMMRPNLIEWRPEVVATSPDGTVSVRVGDGRIEQFAVPFALPMIGMPAPGTRPSAAGGEFLDYLPGAQFLASYYVPRRFGQVANLQGTDLPEVAQQAFRARPPPPPMQGRADAGAVRFEVAGSAGPLIGQYFVTTHFTAPPPGIGGGAGNWEVGLLSGYLCRADREPLAQRVLAEMSRGLRYDVNWYARQLQIDIGHAQTIVAGNQQLNDIVAQTNQMRAAGMDAAQRSRSVAAAGMTEVLDSAGQRYQVPITGHQNYYLVHRTGEVVATDADLPPYDFRVLVPAH